MPNFLWLGNVSPDQKTLSLQCLRSGSTMEGVDRWEGEISFSQLRNKLREVSLSGVNVNFYDEHLARFSLPAPNRYSLLRKLGIENPGFSVVFYPAKDGRTVCSEKSRVLNLPSESAVFQVLRKAENQKWTRPYIFGGLFHGSIGVRVQDLSIDAAIEACAA